MRFQAHLDSCEHCREHIYDLCPEGKRLLHEEAGAVPESMQREAEAISQRGKDLAIHLLDVTSAEHFDPPVMVYALAYLFAGLLSATDGHQTTYEKMGLGLLSDAHRIGMFCDQVKEMVADMRAARTPQADKRLM